MAYEIWDVDVSKRQGWEACVSYMAIKLPNYHPMLEWFVVIMSHLRDVPGAPKANKTQNSSSHEIVIAAVDPEPWLLQDYEPTLEPPPKLLMPLEVVHQFANLDDETAKLIAQEIATTIGDQEIPPDRDHFHDWLRLFNLLSQV